MANQVDNTKVLSETRLMSGRRTIKTSVTKITKDNVQEVLFKALETHNLNRSEIDYLYRYYKGEQPIRYRVKDTRPEICNKIVEMRLSLSRLVIFAANLSSMSAEMVVRKL